MKAKDLIKTHQQNIALSAGYVLVALMAFGLGRISAISYQKPEIRVEQAFTPQPNNTSNQPAVQSATVDNLNGCEGKIKGNINSKGKKIYHLPGGAFYDRTNPEQCFDSEVEAKTAGFTKSSR